MRPVERGAWPVDNAGLPIQFERYQEAKSHLIKKMGLYCSYCELPLDNAATVEHKEPKSWIPWLEKMWCNFLLACAYCQGCKGSTPILLTDYFWPDQDNTLRAFQYENMFVHVHAALDPALHVRAEKTRLLVGLDKVFGAPREPSDNDPRWRKRQEVWGKATEARKRLQRRDCVELREQIEDTATSSGCFSIWMTIFEDDVDMRRRFIEKFVGTSGECFDDAYNACPRLCGAL